MSSFDSEGLEKIDIEHVYHDISQALETLRFSYEAIISIDQSRNIVIFNKGAEQIFGYTADEVIGQSVNVLIPERYHKVHDIHILDFIHKEGNDLVMHHNKSIFGLRKNGEEFPAESSIYMFQHAGNKTCTAVLRDVSEAVALKDRLFQLATHDHLTGLPNRLLFEDRLNTAISRAKRNRKKLALLFLDLDSFKAVNDSLGHQAGDDYLRTIGKRLQAFVRGSDTAARVGGDEFALIMEEIEVRHDVEATIFRLQASLQANMKFDTTEFTPSVSIGMAVYPDDAVDSGQLLRLADNAMFADKTSKIQTDK